MSPGPPQAPGLVASGERDLADAGGEPRWRRLEESEAEGVCETPAWLSGQRLPGLW